MSDPAVSEHRLTREGLGLRTGWHPAHLQVQHYRQQRTSGETKENFRDNTYGRAADIALCRCTLQCCQSPALMECKTMHLSYLIYCCMQLGPDKEWSVIFAVFDENRSWYINENMQKSSRKSSNITDVEFYNSNVIYSKFTTELHLAYSDYSGIIITFEHSEILTE